MKLLLNQSEFRFWVGENSKKLKWRTLTGLEKLRLFTKLNIADHFPELEDKDRKQALWTKLIEINKLLSAKPSEMTNVYWTDKRGHLGNHVIFRK